MGFVRDRRQRVTEEFPAEQSFRCGPIPNGRTTLCNVVLSFFPDGGAGCPDIERHGIMDTAEYTFTVGRVYLFSSDIPSCPAELALWGCFAYRAAGRPCWKPPRATDGIISACFRCRMHTGFAGRHHAANTCGSCDAMPRPVSGAGFRIPFLLNCCLTGNRLYLTDDWAGTVLSAGDVGAFSQPPPRAL